ncbi:MAG: hypothetical protein P8182_07715, partial [Deltaproteobacteria bacterium]
MDSDERGRQHGNTTHPVLWQTYLIESQANVDRRLKPEKHFRYLTFGTSEFYTKDDFVPGAANPNFRHIKLADMITFLRDCLRLPLKNKERFNGWLNALVIEKAKRDNAIDILSEYAQLRNRYLFIAKDIDLPPHRFAFNAPELAFPLFAQVSEIWNDKEYDERFG